MQKYLITGIFLLIESAQAQYENGVVGDPRVECGDKFFEIGLDMRNNFRGAFFVEKYLDDPRCRTLAGDTQQRNTSLKLDFDHCGVQKRKSESPRGVFVSAKLVVVFHPDFLTKVDRVYRVQCFYMEMDRRIEKEVKVNLPPPTLQTKQVPMPVCKYEVLDKTPDGPPVFYATVGQMVYHKWSCEAEQEDTFCMVVHSCYVDDGNGDKVQLLDERGCALDKYLLTNLEYPGDLLAGREAHVYKYADRENMYFDCQITVRLKEPGYQFCEVPTCPDPPRRRRSHAYNNTSSSASAENNAAVVPEDYFYHREEIVQAGIIEKHFRMELEGLCFSTLGMSLAASFNLLVVFCAIAIFWSAFSAHAQKSKMRM